MKHILIDYENIQPTSFGDIKKADCQIWLFLGLHQQKSLSLDLVEALLQFNHNNVHIVRMQNSGKNALDFYLSFYLGKITEIDPQADICILARDSGYDVLVEHLNSCHRGIDIIRLPNTEHVELVDNLANQHPNGQITDDTKTTVENCDNRLFDDQQPLSNQSAITQIIKQELKQNISPAFIHHCYKLVLNEIIKDNAFLPSYKHNFLSAVQKYILKEELAHYSDENRVYIVEQVLTKLVNYGLIIISDDSNGRLSYQISKKDILDLIANFVIKSKPKTIDALKSIISSRLGIYNQVNSEEEVNWIIKWLKQKNIIKQMNLNISYPSSANINGEIEKVCNTDQVNVSKSEFDNIRPLAKVATVHK